METGNFEISQGKSFELSIICSVFFCVKSTQIGISICLHFNILHIARFLPVISGYWHSPYFSVISKFPKCRGITKGDHLHQDPEILPVNEANVRFICHPKKD